MRVTTNSTWEDSLSPSSDHSTLPKNDPPSVRRKKDMLSASEGRASRTRPRRTGKVDLTYKSHPSTACRRNLSENVRRGNRVPPKLPARSRSTPRARPKVDMISAREYAASKFDNRFGAKDDLDCLVNSGSRRRNKSDLPIRDNHVLRIAPTRSRSTPVTRAPNTGLSKTNTKKWQIEHFGDVENGPGMKSGAIKPIGASQQQGPWEKTKGVGVFGEKTEPFIGITRRIKTLHHQ